MEKKGSYAGKIGTGGAQAVDAPFKGGKQKQDKFKRGKDLRVKNGK